MKYMVVIEKAKRNYSAYVPDLPGCVAAAETKNEVIDLIKEALQFHLESFTNDGEQIPEPNFSSTYIEVT